MSQLGAQMIELGAETGQVGAETGQSGAKTVQMGQLGPQIIKEGRKHGRWKMAEGSTLVSNRSLEDSYRLKQA